MRDGFVKVGAATNEIIVANPLENAKNIIKKINKAHKEQVKVLVFPELSITGATCLDLFFYDTLLNDSLKALDLIRRNTLRKNILVIVGLPLKHNNKLYNVAAYINKGKILGFTPKTYFNSTDNKYFSKLEETVEVIINGNKYLLGTNLLFKCEELNELVVASEIGDDLLNPLAPSNYHTLNGATLICNLSASNEVALKEKERLELIKVHSSRLITAYIYSNAGPSESTQDLVFSGHNIICENNEVLKSVNDFKHNLVTSEIDVKKLVYLRNKSQSFTSDLNKKYQTIYFNLNLKEEKLTRSFPTCSI